MKIELEERDALAAEFVLGTLPYEKRVEVSARRLSDPELDALIASWEQQLSPLNEYIEEVEPPDGVLPKLEYRLDQLTAFPAAAVSDLELMRRKIKQWKLATLGSSALAATLAAFMVWKAPVIPVGESDQPFVAVFQQDDKQPAFLMTMNLKTRTMVVKPVNAAAVVEGRTYQLWIKADALGDTPKSLGLLPTIATETRKSLDSFGPELLKTATYGISVEPAGGSPTGVPTGPAIHGYLYPTPI